MRPPCCSTSALAMAGPARCPRRRGGRSRRAARSGGTAAARRARRARALVADLEAHRGGLVRRPTRTSTREPRGATTPRVTRLTSTCVSGRGRPQARLLVGQERHGDAGLLGEGPQPASAARPSPRRARREDELVAAGLDAPEVEDVAERRTRRSTLVRAMAPAPRPHGSGPGHAGLQQPQRPAQGGERRAQLVRGHRR
jgi:hypothetical protein